MYFPQRLASVVPAPGRLALFWLGQAGFLIKAHDGRVLVIDPYLTDCVERLSGYKRLMMPVIEPQDLCCDVYLCTHSHDDHFDVDAAPILMRRSGTVLIGPRSVSAMCASLGIDSSRVVTVREGDCVDAAGFIVTAVYADHGTLEPEALGFLVEREGHRIYFTGDTAYRPERMQAALCSKPDVVVLPINGEFGNLDCTLAALLARDCGAPMAIPSHFWTLAVHRSDPLMFGVRMSQIAPKCEARYLCQGEGIIL